MSVLAPDPGHPTGRFGRATGARTRMIEALKNDEIASKVGGRFKLCSLIQRRLVQLMEGARPLVDRANRSNLEVVIDEILHDKITLEYDHTGGGPTMRASRSDDD